MVCEAARDLETCVRQLCALFAFLIALEATEGQASQLSFTSKGCAELRAVVLVSFLQEPPVKAAAPAGAPSLPVNTDSSRRVAVYMRLP